VAKRTAETTRNTAPQAMQRHPDDGFDRQHGNHLARCHIPPRQLFRLHPTLPLNPKPSQKKRATCILSTSCKLASTLTADSRRARRPIQQHRVDDPRGSARAGFPAIQRHKKSRADTASTEAADRWTPASTAVRAGTVPQLPLAELSQGTPHTGVTAAAACRPNVQVVEPRRASRRHGSTPRPKTMTVLRCRTDGAEGRPRRSQGARFWYPSRNWPPRTPGGVAVACFFCGSCPATDA